MKIRTGFVSNSSSSSFCIIGTENANVIYKLLKAEEIDLDSDENNYIDNGVIGGKVVNFYDGVSGEQPYYAGVDAEPLLKETNIPQACKKFQEMVEKSLGVKIPLSSVKFLYGEISSE